jgi:hypothetical protein
MLAVAADMAVDLHKAREAVPGIPDRPPASDRAVTPGRTATSPPTAQKNVLEAVMNSAAKNALRRLRG